MFKDLEKFETKKRYEKYTDEEKVQHTAIFLGFLWNLSNSIILTIRSDFPWVSIDARV